MGGDDFSPPRAGGGLGLRNKRLSGDLPRLCPLEHGDEGGIVSAKRMRKNVLSGTTQPVPTYLPSR